MLRGLGGVSSCDCVLPSLPLWWKSTGIVFITGAWFTTGGVNQALGSGDGVVQSGNIGLEGGDDGLSSVEGNI